MKLLIDILLLMLLLALCACLTQVFIHVPVCLGCYEAPWSVLAAQRQVTGQ